MAQKGLDEAYKKEAKAKAEMRASVRAHVLEHPSYINAASALEDAGEFIERLAAWHEMKLVDPQEALHLPNSKIAAEKERAANRNAAHIYITLFKAGLELSDATRARLSLGWFSGRRKRAAANWRYEAARVGVLKAEHEAERAVIDTQQ
jgi:hypothetical protein